MVFGFSTLFFNIVGSKVEYSGRNIELISSNFSYKPLYNSFAKLKATISAFNPFSGVLPWHCFPLMLNFIHRIPFSPISTNSPVGVPKSGTMIKSSFLNISSSKLFNRYFKPYSLPSSSSETKINDKLYFGSILFSKIIFNNNREETIPLWLSSLPLP